MAERQLTSRAPTIYGPSRPHPSALITHLSKPSSQWTSVATNANTTGNNNSKRLEFGILVTFRKITIKRSQLWLCGYTRRRRLTDGGR